MDAGHEKGVTEGRTDEERQFIYTHETSTRLVDANPAAGVINQKVSEEVSLDARNEVVFLRI